MKEPKHTGFSILKGKTYEDGIRYENARITKLLKILFETAENAETRRYLIHALENIKKG